MSGNGDYIERDAAVELLSQPITMSMCLSVEECHHKIAQQRIDRYLVENIPAADVRPVKRGEWIDYQQGRWIYAKCSECETVHDVQSNFCPNCGAKMTEEQA